MAGGDRHKLEGRARRTFCTSEIYDGESQDARLRQSGWDTASFDGGTWKSAVAIDPKPLRIEAQSFEPIRVERELKAESLTEPKPGVFVYDFGQNFSGVESLRLKGPEGSGLQLRFAEVLNADGTVYTDNLRTAKATDHFIFDGKEWRGSRRSSRSMASAMPN